MLLMILYIGRCLVIHPLTGVPRARGAQVLAVAARLALAEASLLRRDDVDARAGSPCASRSPPGRLTRGCSGPSPAQARE